MAEGSTAAFRYTEEDLVQAARLYSGRSLNRPQVIVSYLSLWFFSLILFTYLVTGETSPAAVVEDPVRILGLSILPFVLILLWTLWLIPTLARRNFRQQKALQGDFIYRWSEKGLSVQADIGNFEMPWDHFVSWGENANTILILETDRLYRVIPKRVLSPDQQAGLRHYCARIGA